MSNSHNGINRSRPLLMAIAIAILICGGTNFYASDVDSKELHLQVTKLRSLPTSGTPSGIAWSPDGKRIAAIHDYGGEISVWSSDGNVIRSIKREVTTSPYLGSSLAFLFDNKTILAPAPTPNHKEYSTLGLWNSETGALQQVAPAPSSDRIFQKIVAQIFALSPDGSLVAFRPIDSREPLSIYSTGDWSLVKTKQIFRSETVGLRSYFKSDLPGISPPYQRTEFNSPEPVSAFSFAPNNDLAVGLLDGLAILKTDRSSTSFRFLEGKTKPIVSLAYSPSGKFIAIGRGTSAASTPITPPAFLEIRDLGSDAIVVEDDAIRDVQRVAWDREGQILAVLTGGDTLNLYRPFVDGSVRQKVPVLKEAFTLSFSPIKAELAVSTSMGVDIYSIR